MVALKDKGLVADYDEEADVLYLTFGTPRPGYGDTQDNYITLRYSDDGTPIGATIIGYRSLKWDERKKEMASSIARHLGINSSEVLASLRSIGL